MSESKPIVNTSANGMRTVKAIDIIQSEAGKAGLAKSRELFYRLQRPNRRQRSGN